MKFKQRSALDNSSTQATSETYVKEKQSAQARTDPRCITLCHGGPTTQWR
jgi:hypothetical protein